MCVTDPADDLFEVEAEMGEIAYAWEGVGKALHLQPDKIKLIESSPTDDKKRLSQVLQEFLDQNYNTVKYGPPSWRLLVIAVAHSAGGANAGLALRIAQAHFINGKLVTHISHTTHSWPIGVTVL